MRKLPLSADAFSTFGSDDFWRFFTNEESERARSERERRERERERQGEKKETR